jgi:hypothetical protein
MKKLKRLIAVIFLLLFICDPCFAQVSDPYSILLERNIFDPSRGSAPTVTPKPIVPDTLSLHGVFISDDKYFAFFSGNMLSSERTYQSGDTVGGLKIISINTECVQMQDGNVVLTVPVGSNLSHIPNNPWKID